MATSLASSGDVSPFRANNRAQRHNDVAEEAQLSLPATISTASGLTPYFRPGRDDHSSHVGFGGVRSGIIQEQEEAEESNDDTAPGRVVEELAKRKHVMLLLLRKSRFPLPHVRRLALRESIKAARSIETLHELLRENVPKSPYIPDEIKPRLIEAVIAQNWGEVRALITSKEAAKMRCRTASPNPWQSVYWKLSTMIKTRAAAAVASFRDNAQEQTEDYKEFRLMAIAIFASSRKIREKSPTDRRKYLGRLIQKTTCHEDAVQFLLDVLVDSQSLNDAECDRVANDALEGRYDRLLLPDRLDCEWCERLDYDPTVVSEESFDDVMVVCHFCGDGFNATEDGNRRRLCIRHVLCNQCLETRLASNCRYPSCPVCELPANTSPTLVINDISRSNDFSGTTQPQTNITRQAETWSRDVEFWQQLAPHLSSVLHQQGDQDLRESAMAVSNGEGSLDGFVRDLCASLHVEDGGNRHWATALSDAIRTRNWDRASELVSGWSARSISSLSASQSSYGGVSATVPEVVVVGQQHREGGLAMDPLIEEASRVPLEEQDSEDEYEA